MPIVTFIEALVVAQAALMFGSTSAAIIKLYGHAGTDSLISTNSSSDYTVTQVIYESLSLTSFISTSKLSITSPPSIATAVSALGWCSQSLDEWLYCANDALGNDANADGGTAELFFAPPNQPYNTDLYSNNIVPANPSLANYCGSLWSSSAAAFWSTNPISSVTPIDSTTAVLTIFVETFSWKPTATQCCLNCTISGGAIQVLVWPTPAPVPAVTTLVDIKADFTFTSPSVYVVFESIAATNLCGEVGTTIINKTVAFDPDELSTQRNYYAARTGTISNLQLQQAYCSKATPIPGDWSTFDYAAAERGSCTEITTSWWSYYASNDTTMYTDSSDWAAAVTDYRSCGFGCLGQPIESFTCLYNPCSPFVSVPTAVYDLNPHYHTCIDGIKAFFDPPYTLTAGGNLVAFSATSVALTQIPQSVVASPAPTPIPGTPIRTLTVGTPTPTPTHSPKQTQSSSPVAVKSDISSATRSRTSNPKPSVVSNLSSSSATTSRTSNSKPNIVSHSDTATDTSNTPIEVRPQSGSSPRSSSLSATASSTVTVTPGSSKVVLGGSSSTTATQSTPSSSTASGSKILNVGSHTILPGSSAITVSGTVVSLQSGEQGVVISSSTEATSSFVATSSGLGGAILNIGGFGDSTGVPTITGSAPGRIRGAAIWMIWPMAGLVVWWL